MRTNNQLVPAVQEANHVQSSERGSAHEKRRLRTPLAILLGFVLALSGTSILGLTPSVQAINVPSAPPPPPPVLGPPAPPVTCTGTPIEIVSVEPNTISGTTNDKYSFTVKTSRAAYNVEFTFSGSGGTSHAYATAATADKMTWTLSNYTFTTAVSSYTVTAQDSACGTVADPWSANISITTPTPSATPSTNPTTKQNPTQAPTSVPAPAPTIAPVVYITVSFNGNSSTSGTVPASITVPWGSPVTMPNQGNLAKAGYVFAGWAWRTDGMGDVYKPGTSISFQSSITMYAIWVQTITVSFNVNGATSGTVPPPQTVAVHSGLSITVPGQGNLLKTGYVFIGWNTKADGTGDWFQPAVFPTEMMGLNSKTLYAMWAKSTNTVTFNANGGVAVSSQTVSYGSSFYMPSTTRAGYSFTCWSTTLNGSCTYYPSNYYKFTNDMTLYAVWTANAAIQIIFVGKGLSTSSLTPPSSGLGDAITVPAGSSVTMPDQSNMSVTNLTLVSWNEQSDGSGMSYQIGQSYTFKRSITLYPVFLAVVTFDGNGATSGNVPGPFRLKPSGSLLISSAGGLSRTNYVFDGWNTQKDGKGQKYTPGVMYVIPANLTLYAQWKSAIDLSAFSVSITGTPRIGQTLTANPSATSSNFPTSSVTYNYQWMSSQNCPGDDIGWNDAWSDLQTLFPTLRVSSSKNTFTVRSRDYLAFVCLRVTATTAGQNPVSRYAHSAMVLQADGTDGSNNHLSLVSVSAGIPSSTETTARTRITQYSTLMDAKAFVYDVVSTWSLSGDVATLKSVSVANVDSSQPLLQIQQVQIGCGLNNKAYDLWNNGDAPIRAIIDSPAAQVWPNSSGPSTVKCTIQSGAIGTISVSGLGASFGDSGPTTVVGQQEPCVSNAPCLQIDGVADSSFFKGTVNYFMVTQPAPGSNPVQPTGITLSPSSQVVTVGASKSVTATITPGNAVGTTVYWSTSNPDVATVTVAYAGVSQIVNVTGVKLGTTVITARTENGIVAYATVDVRTPFVVSFDANGGMGTVPPSQTVTSDVRITLPGQGSLSRTGYSFAGWNDRANGSGTRYPAGVSWMFSAATTLYAQWTPLPKLTISFNVNGGTGTTPGAKTTTNDVAVPLPVQGNLTRAGYTFLGWNPNADGSSVTYTAGYSYYFSASAVLYAQWTPLPTLTISYSINGGTGTVPTTKTTTSDVAVPLPAQGNLAKAGYTFAGWSTQADGSGTTYAAGSSQKFSASTTLYAKWTALPVLTISFNVNGGTGTTPGAKTTTNDVAVPLPTQGNLVKTGYTFGGWSIQANGSGTTYAAGSSQKFSASTTLYAKWTALPKLTISFNLNGGAGTNPGTQTTTSDAPVTLPAQGNITKVAYTFGGWNTKADGTGSPYLAGTAYRFSASTTLYAKWTALPTLTISFSTNGGSGTVPTTKTTTSDVAVPLPAQGNLTKAGYTFAGWSTQSNGSGTTYTAGSSTKFTASTTLYAKWTALPTLTISYNANNGTGTIPASVTTTSDVAITLSAQGTLTRTGYTFAGWNTKADGSGTTYAAGSSQKFSVTTTLYAKWTALPTLTISFNLNGGSGTVPTTKTTTSDVAVPLPAQGTLARTGYSFGGWNTQANGSGTAYAAGSSQKFSVTTTLYAKWTPLPTLTITFNANGGSGTVPPPMPTTSDAFIVLPIQGNLSKIGYSFDGWNTQTDGLGTTCAAGSSQKFTATMTLYAKWTALPTVTITFNLNGGTGTTPPSISTTSDTLVLLPTQPIVTPVGYTFGGWNTWLNGYGTTYAAGSSQKFSTSTTLYAKWDPLPVVTISYNINNGTGNVPATMTTTSDRPVTLSTQGNLRRVGYTFGGWNTQANGSGTTYAAGSTLKFSTTTTLYAKWTALPTLTVSFNANGGTGTVPAPIKTTSDVGATLPEPGNLTRTGYIFAGWSLKPDGGGTYGPGLPVTITTNTTLYAIWAVPQVTVSYNLNGGTGNLPTSTTVAIGTAVTLATQDTLSRTGYTFGGWNTQASGSGTTYAAGSSQKFTATTTLYAIWTALPATVTISYNANGGTGDLPASTTVANGTGVTVAVGGNLKRTGYTFSGWSPQTTGGAIYGGGESIRFTASVTLYAAWKPLPALTISFWPNGTTGSVVYMTTTSDAAMTLPDQGKLTWPGYTFAGWSSKADGTSGIYAAGTSLTFSANTTMYAIWTPSQVTVSYDANGGTGTVPASQSFTGPKSVVISGQGNLSKPGYTFVGWKTSPISGAGSGTFYYVGGTSRFTESTVLYAVWQSGTVTTFLSFDGNGSTSGTGPVMYPMVICYPVTLPTQGDLVKTGYTFAGWNTKADGTGTMYQPGSSATFTAATALYAIWK